MKTLVCAVSVVRLLPDLIDDRDSMETSFIKPMFVNYSVKSGGDNGHLYIHISTECI